MSPNSVDKLANFYLTTPTLIYVHPMGNLLDQFWAETLCEQRQDLIQQKVYNITATLQMQWDKRLLHESQNTWVFYSSMLKCFDNCF